MIDNFENRAPSASGPAGGAVAIIPNDAEALSFVTRGLYIGLGGDVSVEMKNGQSVVFHGVATGSLLPVRVTKVLATDTTASLILSLE